MDHMRWSSMVPASIRAANLARWFPPWTVSRENWNIALWSSVSGVSTDALLFSCVGAQLMDRYRVFARSSTHAAFRSTYMARLRTFLNVSDAAYLRSQDKCRGPLRCTLRFWGRVAVENRPSLPSPVCLVSLLRHLRRLLRLPWCRRHLP